MAAPFMVSAPHFLDAHSVSGNLGIRILQAVYSICLHGDRGLMSDGGRCDGRCDGERSPRIAIGDSTCSEPGAAGAN
jgi:hypothetical protein